MTVRCAADACELLSLAGADFLALMHKSSSIKKDLGGLAKARRAEIDEHDPNPGEEADYKRWGEDVFAALQALPAATAAACCEWSKPADTVEASGLMEEDDVDTSAGRFHPMYLACYAVIGAMFAARYALQQQ